MYGRAMARPYKYSFSNSIAIKSIPESQYSIKYWDDVHIVPTQKIQLS